VLRLRKGVRVAADGVELWLRGQSLDDELDRELRKIPGLHRFRLEGNRLVPVGRTVPVARLPALAWIGIDEFFRAELPRTRIPAAAPPPGSIRITRSTDERPTSALIVDFRVFHAWAELAPEARLRGLSFALASDGRTFVRGTTLPPLPGEAYWIENSIACPCGFAWEPLVGAAVIKQIVQRDAKATFSGGDGVILLDAFGRWQFIPVLSFVNANRASVRATAAALDAAGSSGSGGDS
jgi:hypothetical protein